MPSEILYLSNIAAEPPSMERLPEHITRAKILAIPTPAPPAPVPAPPAPQPPAPAPADVTLLKGSVKVEPDNGIALISVPFRGTIPAGLLVQLHVVDADTPETFINADFDPAREQGTTKDGVTTWVRAVTLAGLSGGYRVAAGLFANDAAKGWPQWRELKAGEGVTLDTPDRRIIATFTAPAAAPAPVPAPGPTPAPPPASGGPVTDTGIVWFPQSPHARGIKGAKSVRVLPADRRTSMVRGVGSCACNVTQYTVPVNYARTTDPVRTVTVVDPDGRRRKVWQLRVPDTVRISPGTDMHCIVVYPDGRTALELWGAKRLANGDLTAYAGVRDSDLAGAGLGYSKSVSSFSEADPETGGWGACRAWGGSSGPGLIFGGEVLQRKRIAHMLYMGLPKEVLDGRAWRAPATRPDTNGLVSGGVRMGDVFVIPEEVDVERQGFSEPMLVVARAAQEFGVFVGDQSGGATLNSELIRGQADGNALNASGQLMKWKSLLTLAEVEW